MNYYMVSDICQSLSIHYHQPVLELAQRCYALCMTKLCINPDFLNSLIGNQSQVLS